MPKKTTLHLPSVKPRGYQEDVWKAAHSGKRNIIISWPRRHGKDVTTASIICDRALERVGNYYYLFPTRTWAERAIWNNIVTINGKTGPLLDIIFPPEIVAPNGKNNTNLKIKLINGSVIQMSGTDNLDFVGQGGYGYALSEFSLHKEEVTGFMAPILDEGNAWIIMNGTMRGKKNQLHQMYQANKEKNDWFCEWLKPADTKRYCWIGDEMNLNPELYGQIDPMTGHTYLNIQDRVDSKLISYSLACQEYLNEALSDVANSVYGYEVSKLQKDGNICGAKITDDEVYTFWDLGMDDPTAIVFAQISELTGAVVIVDYYESTGRSIDHYIDVIRQKPYRYGGHYMPHDSKKREKMTATNIIDECRLQYGFDVRVIPKTNSVREDIEVVRRLLTSFKFSDLCEDLVDHLTNYQWNPSTGKILHNEHSHGADALRMLGMAIHLRLIRNYLEEKKDRVPKRSSFMQDDIWMIA